MIDAKPASAGSIAMFHRPYGPRIHHDEFADQGGAVDVMKAPADTGTDISISQAARALASARRPKAEAQAEPVAEPTAESAEPATAETELSDEGNADPVTDPGETEEVEPAEPAIDRPKSWSKDEDAEWQSLPRAMQQKIVARESERDKGTVRSQQEAATARKAAEDRAALAEQARTQYETKLKSVVEVLEKEQLREFPDIKSQDDLDKMVSEYNRLTTEALPMWETDPFKAGQMQAQASRLQAKLSSWEIHQRKLVAAHNEMTAADSRNASERQSTWQTHIQTENALAAEKIPELADKKKASELVNRATEKLAELGFGTDELNKLASGEEKISIYDHRLQQLIFAALSLDDTKKAKTTAVTKVAAKPVPPVVRPGTTQPRATADSANVKALTAQFNKSGDPRDGAKLLLARRNSAIRQAS